MIYLHIFVYCLFQFVTNAYVSLLGMHICQMSSIQDQPSAFPSDRSDQIDFLLRLARNVVECVFIEPLGVQTVLTANGERTEAAPFCICDEGDFTLIHIHSHLPSYMSPLTLLFSYIEGNGPMIQCCNSKCNFQWFHFECIGLKEAPAVEDWWCSRDCELSGHYIYCKCHMSTGENKYMVQCSLGEDCCMDTWYHPSCLCIDAEELPGISIDC